MPDHWTVEQFEQLEATVQHLLARPWTAQDLPHLRRVLTLQQQLRGRAYELLGAKEEEMQRLRQLIAEEADPWDQPDERQW
jgi:hypothetical protein